MVHQDKGNMVARNRHMVLNHHMALLRALLRTANLLMPEATMAMAAHKEVQIKATLADNRMVSNFSSLTALTNHKGELMRVMLLQRGHRPERKHRDCDWISVEIYEFYLGRWCLVGRGSRPWFQSDFRCLVVAICTILVPIVTGFYSALYYSPPNSVYLVGTK